MAEAQKPGSPLAMAGAVVGGVGGWALSRYCGPTLWIPLVATALLLILFHKTAFRPKFFQGAIGVTGGHVTWFLIGAIITQQWPAVALDIVLLFAGLLWLWLAPSLAAVVYLGAIQLASLAYNAYVFSSASVGTLEHKSLLVHCLWRVLAIGGLVVGYLRLRKEEQTAEKEERAAEPVATPIES